MLDARGCREHSMRCVELAALATDPVVKQRLSETAQEWARLAFELAEVERKLAEEDRAA
jgi:hypothetical protein